jgi:formate hydrogenlyase subunit 3/multisubunit Na+/H+ antiporter MnhD subunit
MLTGPLFLIVLPLALAAVVYLLRRWALIAASLASATVFVMASLCLRLPLDRAISVPGLTWLLGWKVALGEPMMVLGREFALEPAGCCTLGFIYLIAIVAFLFAWRISQGRLFFPLGLVILSLLGAAVMVRLFLFAVLFLWIASLVAILIIQGERQGPSLRLGSVQATEPFDRLRTSLRAGPGRGALRYLVMVSLAIPPLLIAPWLIDLQAVNPDNLALLRYAAVLLAIGFAILLAVVPFHGWISAVAVDAPPVVAAFLFTVTNAVVLLLMLTLLQSYPWLSEDPQVFSLLRLGGLLMAAVGGLLAFAEQDFGSLLGYAVLSDMGCTLVALGVASPAALTAALLQVTHRSVGLMLTAMGLAVVRHYAGSDSFANPSTGSGHRLAGVAKRMPLSTAGLVLGGLSLAGMPLTAGFPSRWAIYRLFSAPGLALAMLLSGAGVALGYLRGLSILLGPSTEPQVKREPFIASLMILAMIILCLGLGLWPQLLLPSVQRVVESFSLVAKR